MYKRQVLLRLDPVVVVETDRDAIKNGDSDSCAVAEGTADQQERHATVPDMVECH